MVSTFGVCVEMSMPPRPSPRSRRGSPHRRERNPHLKVLVDAGLLTGDKRGVWAYFTLVPGALDQLADVLSTRGAAERIR